MPRTSTLIFFFLFLSYFFLARRSNVKGDTKSWTAGILVVIFTGREQLNVQKKKNERWPKWKKKLCTWWKCRKQCVVVVFIFPLRKASKYFSFYQFSLFWFYLSNMVKMWCLKWDCQKIMPLYFHICFLFFCFFYIKFFWCCFPSRVKK